MATETQNSKIPEFIAIAGVLALLVGVLTEVYSLIIGLIIAVVLWVIAGVVVSRSKDGKTEKRDMYMEDLQQTTEHEGGSVTPPAADANSEEPPAERDEPKSE